MAPQKKGEPKVADGRKAEDGPSQRMMSQAALFSHQEPEGDELALKVLADARKRVAAGWTQGTEARNSRGQPVYHSDPDAAFWSVDGAIIAAAAAAVPDPGDKKAAAAMGAMRMFYGSAGIPMPTSWPDPEPEKLEDYNDAPERTHKEILDALDRAPQMR